MGIDISPIHTIVDSFLLLYFFGLLIKEWWVIGTGFVPLFLGPIGIVISCLTEINSFTWILILFFPITLRKNHINPENRKKESSNSKNNKMYNHSQSQVPPLTNNNHNQHTNNPYIIISPDPTSSYSSCKREHSLLL